MNRAERRKIARSVIKREGKRGEDLQRQRSQLARVFRESAERDLAQEALQKTIRPDDNEESE